MPPTLARVVCWLVGHSGIYSQSEGGLTFTCLRCPFEHFRPWSRMR